MPVAVSENNQARSLLVQKGLLVDHLSWARLERSAATISLNFFVGDIGNLLTCLSRR